MKQMLLTATLVLLSAPALCAPINCGTIPLPPMEYRKPLLAAPKITELRTGDVNAACGEQGFNACSHPALNDIILPGNADPITKYCFIIHESAHLAPNFWPQSHPGAYYGNPNNPPEH